MKNKIKSLLLAYPFLTAVIQLIITFWMFDDVVTPMLNMSNTIAFYLGVILTVILLYVNIFIAKLFFKNEK